MKRKKKLVFGLIITLVLLVGAATYLFVIRDKSRDDDNQEIVTASDEIKADDLLTYLSEQEDYSKFSSFITAGTELDTKITPDVNGVTPKFIIFAANNDAFEKGDVSGFDELSAVASADFRQYYSAVFSPDASGVYPDLSLVDGQKISTIGGHDLLIAKRGKKIVVIDMKGREAVVDSKYVVDPSGNRLYLLDSLLLLQ